MRALLLISCAALLSLVAVALPSSRANALTIQIACNGLSPTKPTLLSPGTLVGTPGNDVLIGSTGDDVIKGLGGNDTICGGRGSDRIDGGTGNDTIIGEEAVDGPCPIGYGADVIHGEAGNDTIIDFCGDNSVTGDAGNDVLDPVSGTADGGTGGDVVAAEDDYASCFDVIPVCPVDFAGHALGGAGRDTVTVSGGVADGGSDADDVTGTYVGDDVRGGSGNDFLTKATTAAMTFNGGSGRDTCETDTFDTVTSCEVTGTN